MDRVYDWAFQTPNQRGAEAASIGLDVDIVDTLGGFTPNTDWRLYFPAEKAGNVHYETKKFAIDSTPGVNDRWQFGFHIRFRTVDNAGGEPAFVFWGLRRNGLPDIELELAPHIDGHVLNLLDANGATVASYVNAFTEDTDHWIEVALNYPLARVRIGDTLIFTETGDFLGDATGDYDAYMRWEGQVDATPSGNNTTMWIGPAYAGDHGSSGEFIGNGGHEVYTARHVAADGDKGCDETGTYPGNAEDLTLGIWTDAADDDITTSARYVSVAGTVIGSIKEMGGPGGDHRPTHVFDGCKYVFVTEGDKFGFYRIGYGVRRSPTNYTVGTSSVASGIKYSEFWSLPGASPAPEIPHELDLAAMGHFADPGASRRINLYEAYFFYFGKQGQFTSGWPAKLVQREKMSRGIGRGMNRGVGR